MAMVVDNCERMMHTPKNGFSSIQFIKDAPIPSHFNKGNAPQAKYKFKNLKGKNVVLVDDICASRNTLRRNIKMVEKAGGHVVACFVFADSNTKEV
jgi:orotate phosphoribosyltransferase-like protein